MPKPLPSWPFDAQATKKVPAGDQATAGRDLVAGRRLREVDLAGERAAGGVEEAAVDAGAAAVLVGALPGDQVGPPGSPATLAANCEPAVVVFTADSGPTGTSCAASG